jgi:hypothetical protein
MVEKARNQIAKNVNATQKFEARLKELELRAVESQELIEDLQTAVLALDYLLHPELIKFIRNISGGPVCDLAHDAWRLRGFHQIEIGSLGEPFCWSNPDIECAIMFFLVEGETYAGRVFANIPHASSLAPIVADIDGFELQLESDPDGEFFDFQYTARRIGWHNLRLKAPVFLHPSSASDQRRLGFVLRGAEMLPKLSSA